jgi:dTDP-3-amino-3,4,6-trideoxy-alpha-D-glucose transaminase
VSAVVPFLDLSRRHAREGASLVAALEAVLASGQILLGPQLAAFEAEFAEWCGARHCVGLASGTDALRLVLTAAGIGAGDEVVVPAFTAVPTAAAVAAVGAVPVPVDVDERTGTIDPAAVAGAVTSSTKAVIVVHLYGRPAEMPEVAAGRGLLVIEDAAQAHGALEPGAPRPTAYSFYPTKNLGGIGDGGAVVTDDDALAAELRLLRAHGVQPDGPAYEHIRVATNSRMSEVEAAALRHRLPSVRAGNDRRRQVAERYRAAAPQLCWPEPHPRHVHHLCVARVPGRRDEFRRVMAPTFATAVHYPRSIPHQPAYVGYTRDPCPRAAAWAAECVSLPCHPELTDDEVDRVCDALAAWT